MFHTFLEVNIRKNSPPPPIKTFSTWFVYDYKEREGKEHPPLRDFSQGFYLNSREHVHMIALFKEGGGCQITIVDYKGGRIGSKMGQNRIR